MKKLAVLMMFVVVAFTGCNGRNETPTSAAYGSGMLSGQVAVTGMANSSPAGVEVSVRGTGMTTVLRADGQFVFANVPENAQLDFRRADDGIEASLALQSGSGFLNVELEKVKARVRGGRRIAGTPSAAKAFQFEGVIVTPGETSIVVFTSKKQEVTINLAPETVIRKGGTLLTPADLLANTRVHVKATKADDVYTALIVIVQNEDDGEDDGEGTPAVVREYEGTVRAMTADQLVVYTSKKKEETFVLNGDTVIRKGSATFDLTQILVGMLVHVKAEEAADGTKTAKLVIVQNTRVEAELEGTVASVDASGLVVTTADGDMTVKVSSSTQIRKSGQKIALADVQVGDQVEVEGTQLDATTVQAKKIQVED